MTNSRFEELERRCKKIKNKKIIKSILWTFFFIAIGTVSYLVIDGFLQKSSMKNIKIKKRVQVKKNHPKIDKKTVKPTLKLEPVIDIPKVIQKPHIQKEIKKIPEKKIQKVIKEPEKTQKIEKKEILKPAFKLFTKEADKETILLKNYSTDKDFSSALNLAKYYFIKKDFKKAIYWAKNANKLDSTKDDSWIIYAKSKYVLGEKEDAIESLKTFLNIFYSKRAAELLKSYEKGQK